MTYGASVPIRLPGATRRARLRRARLAQSTHDVLVARTRTAGVFGSRRSDYPPGQNPPAGAGQRMSLAISA